MSSQTIWRQHVSENLTSDSTSVKMFKELRVSTTLLKARLKKHKQVCPSLLYEKSSVKMNTRKVKQLTPNQMYVGNLYCYLNNLLPKRYFPGEFNNRNAFNIKMINTSEWNYHNRRNVAVCKKSVCNSSLQHRINFKLPSIKVHTSVLPINWEC